MSLELEQTVDIDRDDAPGVVAETLTFAHIPSDSHVSIGGELSADRVTDRFQESTRQLLRSRLMLAALTLLGMMGSVMILVGIFGEPSLREVVIRAFAMLSMFSVFMFLRRDPEVGLSLLRRLEVLMIAIPMLEALTAQVFETERYLVNEQYQTAALFQANIGFAVAMFIAIYGMFIPSNWRRTALITFVAALLPTLVAFVHAGIEPRLQELNIPNLAMASLLVMMSAVATLGSHVVHGIRREFESAKLYGQYELTRELGRGGMGVVYKAQHQLLKRPAAIKLIRGDAARDRTAIGRFEQEVQFSATLSHWNTVQIYDYGRTDDGDFFYVMEYLQGESLAERLRREGRIDIESTIQIVRQLCDGLEEAHAKGMVHRDLKPGNVFLSLIGGKENVVKILDFGLAIMTRKNDVQKESTCGSPPYMSPEQIRGEEIDGRSDIYAIGCILYECVTGKVLFGGDSIKEVLSLHLEQIPELERVPEEFQWLRPIIRRCLGKLKNDRFENVSNLRDVLMKSYQITLAKSSEQESQLRAHQVSSE